MKKIIILIIGLFILTGCQKRVDIDYVKSSDLYIRKIENLSDNFIMGMDASSIISLENSNVSYYDYNGNEADVFKTLAESGINYIRVRVWNNPYDKDGNGYGGGNCDINNAIEIGKRATQYGMKLLVDFHYSDFWADPSKQMCPKDWKGLSIEEKAEALYQYTKDCLTQLKKAKVNVGMVQLGNETNGSLAGEKTWMNIIHHLMASGSKAVREVFPKALVAVHFANPEKTDSYRDYAKKLDYYNLDYDVFASSYYPFWHGTLDNLASILSEIAEKYNKKVMVMETSYPYTSEDTDFFGNTISDGGGIIKNYPFTKQGQVNCLLDIIDTINNKTTNGIGICYWEGTWISVGNENYEKNSELWEKYGSGWATSFSKEYDPNDAGKYYGGCAVDNQALFDSTGHPLESLKVFQLAKTGNITELKADAIGDVQLQVDLNGTIILPNKVDAIMSDNSKKQIDVQWLDVDYDKMYNNGVAKYDIVGTADGLTAHCYVSMVEYNFIKNYSFEVDSHKTAIPTDWKVYEYGKADELYVEEKQTDSLTGSKQFHFWSANSNSVEFALEQIINDLPKGNYKFTISIMGGDAGNTDIYSYVKINGNVVTKSPLKITSYNNWDTQTTDVFSYNGNDNIVVGIYVKCSGASNGAWGKIDDALLNSVSEK